MDSVFRKLCVPLVQVCLQRKAQEGSGEEAAATTSVQPAVQTHKVLRTYGQKRPKLDPTDDTDAPVMPQDVLSLLGGKK